jgi:probable F420-dependent oxidoreductase
MIPSPHCDPQLAVFADSSDESMPLVELALAIEERGFAGLFLNEHPHLPIDNARSPYPGDGEVPEFYAHNWDPYIALAFVAAHTKLLIGTSVSLVAEHDAIALAKEIATLDVLSGGRLVLGVGWGWHREEFEDHGLPANRRAAVLRETVELMTALWTQEVASYEGAYRRVSPSRSWPKPVQRPRPPVLLGVPPSDRNFDRIATYADGWMPMYKSIFDDDLQIGIQEIRRRWMASDRSGDPKFAVILRGIEPADLPRAFDRAARLGVELLLLKVPVGSAGEILRRLDVFHAATR